MVWVVRINLNQILFNLTLIHLDLNYLWVRPY